jgi:polar amino acid transport system substrate-binding protein
MTTVKRRTLFSSVVLLVALLVGCASGPNTGAVSAARSSYLRVGVTPDFPPVIFKEGDRLLGIEADLAHKLAETLGRQVQFVELSWAEQIPALLAGQTDIIMSGMTITRERELRISFTDPYLRSGLLALMRTADAGRFNSRESILQSSAVIGVKRGTTADVFVQRYIPRARKIELPEPRDAPFLLQRGEIDLFIHDAPSVAWLASENEASLTALLVLLTDDQIAWGVRRDDPELRAAANRALAEWRKDGTLDGVLRHWLPYLDRLRRRE